MSHLTPVNTTLSGVSGQMAYGERPLAPPITQEAGNSTVTTEGLVDEKLFGFLADGLKNILDAELQLLAALPMAAEAAASHRVITIIEEHMADVEKQVSRLHDMFEILQIDATAQRNMVMEGHVGALQRAIAKTQEGTAMRNAQLINVLHKIARYHEASYLSLLGMARIINFKNLSGLLELSLAEKHIAGNMFATIGTRVNPENFNASVINNVPYAK